MKKYYWIIKYVEDRLFNVKPKELIIPTLFNTKKEAKHFYMGNVKKLQIVKVKVEEI